MFKRKNNKKKREVKYEESIQQRNLSGSVAKIFIVIAVFMTLLHLFILNFYPIEPWLFRTIHVVLGSILGFALFPGWKQKNNSSIHWLDWICIGFSVGIFVYIYVLLDELTYRAGVMPTTMDFIVSLIGVLLILELTRRTTGWALPILSLIFILYAFAGPILPGMFYHNGYSVERFFSYIYGMDGIFGVTTDVSSKYLILFITFGAFLHVSKVGNYFMDLSFSIAGGLRGGPAKVAVVSSALMGTMSGSSAGNVVTTGSLTIPLMKKVGYSPRFAAATEAAASTGGQIMPPVMGAGAFLLAEILGIPYTEVIVASIIPALLYFTSIYFMIDLESIKNKLRGLKRSELPSFKACLKQSYLIIPILILIGSLVMGFSIIRSGTVAIISCLIISWISKQTRMGWKETVKALEEGSKGAVQLIAVCACAGIIVGVIALTGVGMRFSSLLLSLAGSSQFLALLFAMLIAILLGCGMPTTAAYAVAASVVAPGLVQVGIEPLHAHFFIFYFAVVSAITPPVAIAAFAAAGISGTNPMSTGVAAFRLGLAAYIVPFMFIYSPTILMEGDPLKIGISLLTSLVGVYFLASGVQGYFFGTANWLQRLLLLAASVTLINATFLTDIVGICLALIAFIIAKVKPKVNENESTTFNTN
jgi:TRAP transporter 4TM/12TM fusion protein